jgi:hypothetical protein
VEVIAADRPRSAAFAWARALARGSAWTIERHRHPALAREVARRLGGERPAAVVAEQLQAFAQARPAHVAGVPLLLRAQNVESELWAAAAALASGARRRLLRREAERVARAERDACRDASAVVALTTRDAAALRTLAGHESRTEVIGAPFPAALPAAGQPLAGEPSVVMVGSAGWLPNRDQAEWFLREAWPAILAARPGAVLHVFGAARVGATKGVVARPAPRESREAFAPGSILAVPARIASGLRMKILEGWARGLPVVASPAAAEGLDAGDGDALLLARSPEEWARAIARLVDDAGLAPRLVAGGRRTLAERHAPGRVAAAWTALLGSVAR